MKVIQKHSISKDNLLSIIILAIVGIVVFVFNYLTPLVADDYAYSCIMYSNGQRLKSISDLFVSQYIHYFTVNGRTVTHFLAQLFLLLGKPVFCVINTFAFLTLGITIYYHGSLSVKSLRPLPLSFIFFSFFLFTPDFGESFLWVTGAANYLYGPLITLLFLIPYRKAIAYRMTPRPEIGLKFPHAPAEALYAAGMFFLGLLAGNANENNGVLAVFVACCYIAFIIIRRQRLSAWHCTAAIGAIIGCIFMLLSPGTRSRLGDGGFQLSQIFIRIRWMTLDIMERFGVLFFIFALLFSVLFVYYKKARNNSFVETIATLRLPVLNLLLFGISFYALAVPPWFAYRVWTTFMVFLLIAILCSYELLETELLNSYSSAGRFSACMISVLLLGIAFNNYPELRSVHDQYNARLHIIEQAKENDQSEVYLPAISSSSRFSCFGPNGDIMPEDTAWQNHLMASYYGFDKVFASDEK